MHAEETELGLTVQLRWVEGQNLWVQYDLGNWDRALELGAALIEDEDAGRSHYLVAGALAVRSMIRDARNEPGGAIDVERALESARRAGDAQVLGPILGIAASRLARVGAPAEASRLLDELVELLEGASGNAYAWNPTIVRAFAELGVRERYRALLAAEPSRPWVEAALAMSDGDCARAAEIYEGFGAVTQAAEMRLVAARDLKAQGDGAAAEAQAAIAAAYFAARGASARVREVEQLLAATA